MPKKVAFQVDNDLLTVGEDQIHEEGNAGKFTAQERIIDSSEGPAMRKKFNGQSANRSLEQVDEMIQDESSIMHATQLSSVQIDQLEFDHLGYGSKVSGTQNL